MPSDRQTLAQGLFSAAFNGGAGVGAGLGGLAVRKIGYRNTFLVFTAGFVVATVAAFVELVDDSPPEDERRWQRPRDEFEEDGDLVEAGGGGGATPRCRDALETRCERECAVEVPRRCQYV